MAKSVIDQRCCHNKSKGIKCFKCNEFGHKALNCKKEKPKKMKYTEEITKKTEPVNSVNTLRGMYKTIRLKDKEFNALVDTGRQLNIINQSIYHKIGAPTLLETGLRFSGFDGSEVKSIKKKNISKILF